MSFESRRHNQVYNMNWTAIKRSTLNRTSLPFFSLFSVFGARAPEANTTAYNELVQMGVQFTPGEGRTAKAQAGYQIAALGVTLCISLLGGLITGTGNCMDAWLILINFKMMFLKSSVAR